MTKAASIDVGDLIEGQRFGRFQAGLMFWICTFMLFARCVDLFWIIEPNFRDSAGNLHLAGNIGILAYLTVPVAVIATWVAYYITKLMERPLIVVNDPHLEEILEPEHAH